MGIEKIFDFLSNAVKSAPHATKSVSPVVISPTDKPYTFKGDEISFERLELNCEYFMKIIFPNNQIVRVPYGTVDQKVRYNSPADNTKRMVLVSYVGNLDKCRIRMSPVEENQQA